MIDYTNVDEMDKETVAAFVGTYNMAIQGDYEKIIPDTLQHDSKMELIRYVMGDKPATKKQRAAFRQLLEILLV